MVNKKIDESPYYLVANPKFLAVILRKDFLAKFERLAQYLEDWDTLNVLTECLCDGWGQDVEGITRTEKKFVLDFILDNLKESDLGKYRVNFVCRDNIREYGLFEDFVEVQKSILYGAVAIANHTDKTLLEWEKSLGKEEEDYNYKVL